VRLASDRTAEWILPIFVCSTVFPSQVRNREPEHSSSKNRIPSNDPQETKRQDP
jgi:hypothetical protein